MFKRFGKYLSSLFQRRGQAEDIRPESFQSLARELKDLSQLAERLWPQEHQFYAKIKRIQAEMEQLDRLASRPEFKRLSHQKRLQLRQSLIQSRNQLMETVQTAPSPTSTLQ